MKTRQLMIGICMMILLAAAVQSLGVAPSRELIPFDTHEHTFKVRVINSEQSTQRAAIFLGGELAPYATLNKDTMILGAGTSDEFEYTIKLPDGLAPGQRSLDVMVAQIPQEMQGDSTVYAGIIAAHQLKVDVPYPGEYAEGKLYISSSKKGEPLVFTIQLANKGAQDLNVVADIVIKGPTNEQVARFNLGRTMLSRGSASKIEGQIVNDLNPGQYVAEAVIQYGSQTTVVTKEFYSGDMVVDVISVTPKDFRFGSVAKFDVELENRWNQPVDVYADMTVMDETGNNVYAYKTGTSRINALARSTINSFWDTQGMKVGRYDIKIALHYGEQQTEKIFSMIVGLDSIEIQDSALSGNVVAVEKKSNNLIVLLVIVLVAINIGWFVYFKYMRKQPPAQIYRPPNNQI